MNIISAVSSRHKKMIYDPIRIHAIRNSIPKNHNLENTIVLTGLPRSGTTWLGEILNTIPNSAIIFEPLHLRKVPEAEKAGFTWQTLFQDGEGSGSPEKFMREVLCGRVINKWTARELTVKKSKQAEMIIVKFVRASNLLGWLSSTFPIRKPLFIIRHPCAVISSQIERNIHPDACIDHLYAAPVIKLYPHLKSKLEPLKTPMEILAAHWCIGNYYAMTILHKQCFELICYEQLVSEGVSQLEKIFSAIGVKVPQNALEQLKIPSMTAHLGDPWKGGNPLAVWQRRLSDNEIESILAVVKSFGMDFYTDKLEPDYSRLYTYTNKLEPELMNDQNRQFH